MQPLHHACGTRLAHRVSPFCSGCCPRIREELAWKRCCEKHRSCTVRSPRH
ncbi:MAG: hypothetical protein E2O73_06635 [Deltaproteobacteria bacterium]|nr:MAG: hypothetical protein E2O73_06635 [Deltaproteobacteria bacterium]